MIPPSEVVLDLPGRMRLDWEEEEETMDVELLDGFIAARRRVAGSVPHRWPESQGKYALVTCAGYMRWLHAPVTCSLIAVMTTTIVGTIRLSILHNSHWYTFLPNCERSQSFHNFVSIS